jgi:hypothetical protein
MNRQVHNRRTTILASIALVTTLMMLTAPTVYAASPDLTIVDFGVVGDSVPFLTVEGTVGGTVPEEEGEMYAYGFGTDDGIFAAISDGGDWKPYHLEVNVGGCITKMTEEGGEAVLEGDTLTMEIGIALDVDTAFTAVISEEVKDTSGEEDVEDATCIVKVFSGKLPELPDPD